MADLVIILIVAGIGFVIWRFVGQIRKLRAQDRMMASTKPLGMEATDVDQFALDKWDRHGRDQINPVNATMNQAAARQQVLARKLNPQEQHQRYDPAASATKLVKGIATHNPVVLFMDGKAATTTDETAQLVCDLLNTLEITFKDVDVPSDPDMHLGLPQKDGQTDLPYLYIDGIAVGGAQDVLAMAQSGAMQDVLVKKKIPHNAEAASDLIT